MKKISVLFVLLLMAVASKAQAVKYLYIADSKIGCIIGDVAMSCLQVRTNPDSVWRAFPYDIEGFIHEPGIEVMIEMTETPVLNASPDSPAFRYKYIRTVEVKNTVIRQRELLGASKWKLVNIQEQTKMIPRVRMLNAWVQFNLDSNTVRGFGGCNSFGGNAEVNEGEINFGQMYATKMSCQHDSIERIFIESIQSNTQFYLRNNILFITCQNGYTLHFRPEKRIDSLVNEFSKPHIYRGNTYSQLKDGRFGVTLDDLKEGENKNYLFNSAKLSETEKKTILYKLVNVNPDNNVVEIRILRKPHKNKEIHYAEVILKDGTKRNILIRSVL